MLCPSPSERCRMVHPHPCTPTYDGPCFARPQCEDVCFNHFCDTGKVCRPRLIECDDPPCYPVAECTGVCNLFCDRLERFYSAIHKATGLTVPGRSMIWLVPFHRSTVPSLKSSMEERPLGVIPTGGFFWEWLVTKEPAALWIALLICRLLKWLSVFIFLSLSHFSLFEEIFSGFLSA